MQTPFEILHSAVQKIANYNCFSAPHSESEMKTLKKREEAFEAISRCPECQQHETQRKCNKHREQLRYAEGRIKKMYSLKAKTDPLLLAKEALKEVSGFLPVSTPTLKEKGAFTMIWKVESFSHHSGFPCVVLACSYGYRCGYVGVPSSHPAFKKQHTKLHFDVHGGVTFTGTSSEHFKFCDPFLELWWVGFDCAHRDDALDSALLEIDYQNPPFSLPKSSYATVKTLEFAIFECYHLAEQLFEMEEREKENSSSQRKEVHP